ncbi:ATP-binding protein, partial [Pseudobacillus badius]
MNGVRDPYPTCDECLVKDWCGRRNGTSPLPIDYDVNPECGGYVMLEQAFRLSGIPAEFRNANRRNFQYDQDNISYKDYLEDTFDRIVDFVDKGTNIAFIHPNKGTGKTHTVCTIANEYIFRACIGLTPE